jgi:Mg2+/Co2+ transporter CorB
LGKLKLKTQLLKPLSRPYLLQWVVEVAVAVLEVVEVVVVEVPPQEVAEVAAEQVAVR